jgi:hypothetical protein
MADNTGLVIVAGSAGDTIRTIDRGTAKTQVVQLDLGGEASENMPVGSIPVTGTFWQATQPVSGTFWQATQPVSGTFWQSTQPVSVAATLAVKPDGTVWALTGTSANVDVTNFPATQAVSVAATLAVKPDGTVWTLTGTSANVDVTNTVAVSGTFWQNTQPVSIAGNQAVNLAQYNGATVGATNAQFVQPGTGASFAVTGTFWQTTQPVSGTFWQTTQPVSGTFWQTTQPVSVAATLAVKPDGTVWALTGTSANANVTNFPATQPISAVALPLPAGAMPQTGGTVGLVAGTANIGLVTETNASPMLTLLQAILTEMRITNALLQAGLNVQDDIEAMRADPFYNFSVLQ